MKLSVSERSVIDLQEAEWPLRVISAANAREHWSRRARRVKGERGAALALARSTLRLPKLPCTITLTRVAPRTLDDDNLVSGFKPIRDGLADWLGVVDNDPCVTWVYRQAKGGVRQYAVRVEVRS